MAVQPQRYWALLSLALVSCVAGSNAKLIFTQYLKRPFRRPFLGSDVFSTFHRRDFVFRFRDAHQPMIEPAHNVLQSLDPMPWLTRAREFVGFVGESHHHRWNLSEL